MAENHDKVKAANQANARKKLDKKIADTLAKQEEFLKQSPALRKLRDSALAAFGVDIFKEVGEKLINNRVKTPDKIKLLIMLLNKLPIGEVIASDVGVKHKASKTESVADDDDDKKKDDDDDFELPDLSGADVGNGTATFNGDGTITDSYGEDYVPDSRLGDTGSAEGEE